MTVLSPTGGTLIFVNNFTDLKKKLIRSRDCLESHRRDLMDSTDKFRHFLLDFGLKDEAALWMTKEWLPLATRVAVECNKNWGKKGKNHKKISPFCYRCYWAKKRICPQKSGKKSLATWNRIAGWRHFAWERRGEITLLQDVLPRPNKWR